MRSGLALIRAEQLSDGGFSHGSKFAEAETGGSPGAAVSYRTTFSAANVLACLRGAPDASDIRDRAAGFLLGQKSGVWSLNYWPRGSEEAVAMPYPDDLDDTFVALAALYGYDASLIGGAALAGVAKVLTTTETAPGGPYRTWLAGAGAPEKWCDVDVAVNSNVGYFLSLIGVALPRLSKLVDERVAAGVVGSPYYPGIVPVVYFISRFYRGLAKGALAEMLVRARGRDGLWRNPLETAMAISALINFDFAWEVPAGLVRSFVDSLGREGWLSHPFCVDPARGGRTCYAGSPALTAAFSIEAIGKVMGISRGTPLLGAPGPAFPASERLDRIKRMAREGFRSLPERFRAAASERIALASNDEVVAIPYLMRDAMRSSGSGGISEAMLDELALANLYGWTAYTIYDGAMDGDGGGGDAALVPVANFFLRSLAALYADIGSRVPGVGKMFAEIVDGMDAANFLESEAGGGCPVGHLADRSLGHALPALALLLAAGYTPDSAEVLAMRSFFRNYLIARQLHDDARDWRDDLRRGRKTSVVGRLGDGGEKVFWGEVVPSVMADIGKFLDRAKCDLAECAAIGDPAPFDALLERLRSAAGRTLGKRDEIMAFMAQWQSK